MRRRGFTFIELLIAISVFSAGVVTLLEIFPVNRRFLVQSADTTQAVFLAQEEVETIRGVSYANLTPGTYEAAHTLGSGTGDPLNQYTRATIVTLLADNGTSSTWTSTSSDQGLKKVDVTVTWTEHNVSRQYVTTTYVSN